MRFEKQYTSLMNKLIILLCASVSNVSYSFDTNILDCTNKLYSNNIAVVKKLKRVPLNYAKHFELYSIDQDVFIMKVIKNINDAGNGVFYYIFANEKSKIRLENKCRNFFVIRTPARRIVTYSTTYVGMLDALGDGEKIVGVVNNQEIYNEKIKQQLLKSNSNIGYPPSIEKVLTLKPDLLVAYFLEAKEVDNLNKIEKLKVPLVYNFDFLEEHPLARSEWIKFFGIITNKYKKSEEIYKVIENNYLKIKDTVANNIADKKLKIVNVAMGSNYSGIWYIPGAQSIFGILVSDASAQYIWSDTNPGKERTQIVFEKAMVDLRKANFWLPHNSFISESDVLQDDKRYLSLKLFSEKRIYNNTKKVKNFANDYWESGVLYVDLLLMDLVKIFYPDLEISKKHRFIWYHQI